MHFYTLSVLFIKQLHKPGDIFKREFPRKFLKTEKMCLSVNIVDSFTQKEKKKFAVSHEDVL